MFNKKYLVTYGGIYYVWFHLDKYVKNQLQYLLKFFNYFLFLICSNMRHKKAQFILHMCTEHAPAAHITIANAYVLEQTLFSHVVR